MLYLNDHPITPTIFPDKTSQVWKLPEDVLRSSTHRIQWVFENEGELMHLAQLVDLLNSRYPFRGEHILDLTYLPYARQDKEPSNEATFALYSFAGLLNSLNFDRVNIVDPHSNVALGLIRNSYPIYPTDEVARRFAETAADLVCYPDKGALTKYSKIYDLPYIHGEKDRDQSTGKITGYEVKGDVAWKRILIVDDLCDGGATFTILTKALRAYGALEVNLFVTHGIFSRGIQPLKDAGISRVFTPYGER